MSADDGDLLFPRSDALVIPDFNHLPDFEDFTQDLLLGNAIDSISGADLAVDFDSKGNVSAVGFSDSNDFTAFSTVMEEEEEEEEEVKVDPNAILSSLQRKGNYSSATRRPIILSEPMGFKTFPPTIFQLGYDGLSNGNGDVDMARGRSGTVHPEQVELPSPTTTIATKKLNRMSLNEVGRSGTFLHVPPELGNSDESFSTPASVLKGRTLTLNTANHRSVSASLCPTSSATSSSPLGSPAAQVPGFPSSLAYPPSAMHNGSSVSSPTHSSSDGSCAIGTSSGSVTLNDLVNGIILEDEGLQIPHVDAAGKQSADLATVTNYLGAFGRHTSQMKSFGNGHGAIPSHMVEDASQFPSMQRSHSSHALGQLRSIAPTRATNEDFRISSLPSPERPMSALSNLGPYKQPPLSDLTTRPSIASMRRVYSTGDLQAANGMQICYGSSSPLPLEQSNMEEGGMRIGHYTLEERRMKLHRYRQKRMERNFNKKIKYACRKTLADSRPRIRGRFARTDEVGEPVIKANGTQHDEEDEEGEDSFLTSQNPVGDFWEILRMQANGFPNPPTFG